MADPIKTTSEIVSKNDVQVDSAQDPNKIQINIEDGSYEPIKEDEPSS